MPQPLSDLARLPLLLSPSDTSGWFSGATISAADPVRCDVGVSNEMAADALQREFDSGEGGLTAVLLPYEGSAEMRVYDASRISEHEWGGPGGDRGFESAVLSSGSDACTEPLMGGARFDMDEPTWTRRVLEAQELIRAGGVYVLNLTMRATGEANVTPPDAFEQLCERAAAPMAAFWGSPTGSIASVSPERFLSVVAEGGARRVEVWPIKGTAPRGADTSADERAVEALLCNEKERAEHVMIVDLERNDLGRVCESGSVGVEPLMDVFATPYCHQMVSRVHGTLRPDATFGELLEATFPCGSVTGAPKIAAMRIIRNLENSARGAYTGALLVARRGRMDSSVLIRSLEYLPGGRAQWGTGCGITIDSDPVTEWREACLKASPVLGAAREPD